MCDAVNLDKEVKMSLNASAEDSVKKDSVIKNETECLDLSGPGLETLTISRKLLISLIYFVFL